MVIRSVHVPNVEQPHIPHIQDLVVSFTKEALKVLCWFEQLTKPNHSGQIWLPTLQESTSQLNIASAVSPLRLYSNRTYYSF